MSYENQKNLTDQLKQKFEEASIKYSMMEENGKNLFFVSFSIKRENDTQHVIDLMIHTDEQPDRITFFVNDVYVLNNIIDKEIERDLFKYIAILNTTKVNYGNFGINNESSSIVYSNSVSLKGRDSLEKEELLDYVIYSIFICEHINIAIEEYVKEGSYS